MFVVRWLLCHVIHFLFLLHFDFVSTNFVHRYGYYYFNWSVAASAAFVAFYLFLLHFDFVGIQRSHVLVIVTRTNDNSIRCAQDALLLQRSISVTMLVRLENVG